MIRISHLLSEPKVLLGSLALVLAAALTWQVYASGDQDNASIGRKGTGAALAATVLPDFKMGNEASAYNEIVARPLLNPSRRPAPLQAVSQATEPPKPQIRRGLYELIGILDAGDTRLAQVRELAANRVHTIRVGEQLQEFRVKVIAPEYVALEFAGEVDEVRLPKYTNSGKARSFAPPPAVATAAMPATPALQPQSPPSPTPMPIQSAQASPPAAGPVPVPATAPRPAAPAMDSRQQAEFLARRQEARRAWGDKM